MFFQECIMDLTKPALCLFKWRLSEHLLLLEKMFIYQCHVLLLDEETKAQLSLLFSEAASREQQPLLESPRCLSGKP